MKLKYYFFVFALFSCNSLAASYGRDYVDFSFFTNIYHDKITSGGKVKYSFNLTNQSYIGASIEKNYKKNNLEEDCKFIIYDFFIGYDFNITGSTKIFTELLHSNIKYDNVFYSGMEYNLGTVHYANNDIELFSYATYSNAGIPNFDSILKVSTGAFYKFSEDFSLGIEMTSSELQDEYLLTIRTLF